MPNREDGIELVDIQYDDEEWITDHPDPKFVEGSNSGNTSGSLRHGMGDHTSMMELSRFWDKDKSPTPSMYGNCGWSLRPYNSTVQNAADRQSEFSRTIL
jgi:hypothetical protein